MISEIVILGPHNSNTAILVQLLKSQGFSASLKTSAEDATLQLKKGNKLLVVDDSDSTYTNSTDNLKLLCGTNKDNIIILLSDQKDPEKLVKVANTGINKIFTTDITHDTLLETVSEYIKAGPTTTAINIQSVKAPKPTHEIPQIPQIDHYFTQSYSSRKFIEKLWESYNYYHFTTILAPEEKEMSLVLSELSAWSGDSDRKILSVSATELISQETEQTFHKLKELNKFSSIINVHSLDRLDDFTQLALAKFIMEEAPIFHKKEGLFFVFEVRTNEFKNLENKLNPLLFQELFTRILWIRPLRDRPADICFYLKQNLRHDLTLNEDALAILLTYSWPKHFSQLRSFVNQANSLENTTILSAQETATLLGNKELFKSENKTSLNLKDALICQQNKILQHSEDNLRFPELLEDKIHADFT